MRFGMTTNGILAILCLGLAGIPASGADLIETYRLAKASDPMFASDRFTLDATQQKVPEARSSLLPSLSTVSSIGRTTGPVQYTGVPAVDRPFNTLVWTVQLTIPVLHVANIVVLRQSHTLVDEAEAQFAKAQQDLILRVAGAYFDVLAARETLEAALAQERAADEQRSAAHRSYEKGVASVTDSHEADSRGELATSQRIAAEATLAARRTDLEKIVGPLSEELAMLRPDSVTPMPEPDDVSAWTATARDNNWQVKGALAASERADLEIIRVASQRLPGIDLVGSYGRNYSSGNDTNPINYATNADIRQVALQLTVPIIDGGGISAMTREARARSRKALADLEASRRQSIADARDAFMMIRAGVAQIKALQASALAAAESAKGNQVGYQVGIRINSDVLTAQQQLFIARRDLARARYDALMQGLQLKAAAGALTERDLEILNGMLNHDPAKE
jgi:outer membrane protein